MFRGKTVYICSPLSAPTAEGIRGNMLQARKYMAMVAGHFHCRTVAPHAYLPELLDDSIPAERALGLSFGLSLLELSDIMVICGKVISEGMKGEIDRARKRGMPVSQLLILPGGLAIADFRQDRLLGADQIGLIEKEQGLKENLSKGDMQNLIEGTN